jgi:hypothetical protein
MWLIVGLVLATFAVVVVALYWFVWTDARKKLR